MTHQEPIAPDTFYCGTREAIIAEVGGLSHIYPGAYLLQPAGPAAYDAEGADTLKELEKLVSEYAALYPAARVAWL